MIIEQLLKEWIAERSAAVDLTVAARSAKAIASEIEGFELRVQHFNEAMQPVPREAFLHEGRE